MVYAGGPHWPEQDAQIGIAWIVGEDWFTTPAFLTQRHQTNTVFWFMLVLTALKILINQRCSQLDVMW